MSRKRHGRCGGALRIRHHKRAARRASKIRKIKSDFSISRTPSRLAACALRICRDESAARRKR
jgi:hypothetical protein